MGVTDEINIKITGQVDSDSIDNKRRVLADLEAVCAKYDLVLAEVEE